MAIELSEPQRGRLSERSAPDWGGLPGGALLELPELPGMITAEEGRYLYWLTSRGYLGVGAVVELGPWLGKSTIHLAAGLREAGYDDVLHCYDRFVWDAGQAAKAVAQRHDLPLEPGGDFQPFFEANVRPIYPGVNVYKQELREAVWEGGPIEILFLDAPKRLREISTTLAAFGPWLIPGLSVIVLQDYLHFPSYALAAVMSRLADRLDLIHVVEGNTVTMAVRKPLDFADAQPLDWDFTLWTRQEALEAWQRVLRPLDTRARERLEPGITMLLYDCGEIEAACEIARNLRPSGLAATRWEKWSRTSLYDRYQPVFEAAGFGRRGSSGARPKPDRKKQRNGGRREPLRRAWRTAYLKARQFGGRLLRWTHLRAPKASAK